MSRKLRIGDFVCRVFRAACEVTDSGQCGRIVDRCCNNIHLNCGRRCEAAIPRCHCEGRQGAVRVLRRCPHQTLARGKKRCARSYCNSALRQGSAANSHNTERQRVSINFNCVRCRKKCRIGDCVRCVFAGSRHIADGAQRRSFGDRSNNNLNLNRCRRCKGAIIRLHRERIQRAVGVGRGRPTKLLACANGGGAGNDRIPCTGCGIPLLNYACAHRINQERQSIAINICFICLSRKLRIGDFVCRVFRAACEVTDSGQCGRIVDRCCNNIHLNCGRRCEAAIPRCHCEGRQGAVRVLRRCPHQTLARGKKRCARSYCNSALRQGSAANSHNTERQRVSINFNCVRCRKKCRIGDCVRCVFAGSRHIADGAQRRSFGDRSNNNLNLNRCSRCKGAIIRLHRERVQRAVGVGCGRPTKLLACANSGGAGSDRIPCTTCGIPLFNYACAHRINQERQSVAVYIGFIRIGRKLRICDFVSGVFRPACEITDNGQRRCIIAPTNNNLNLNRCRRRKGTVICFHCKRGQRSVCIRCGCPTHLFTCRYQCCSSNN